MLSHTSFRTKAVAIAALFLAPAAACGVLVVPDGLSPGDTYHYAFVTDGTTTATSTDIADYNTFVQNEAQRAGAYTKDWGIQWFAIGSTATVDARENAVVSAPVYMLDGTQIATGYADMWAPKYINISVEGVAITEVRIWTGSNLDGTTSSNPLGNPNENTATLTDVFTNETVIHSQAPKTYAARMYGLSEILCVGYCIAIPEPSMLYVWSGLATAGVWVSLRRRRKP